MDLDQVQSFGSDVSTSVDVVPLQSTNVCDVGLAALGRFGHKEVNIVQKASKFFSTILAFAVQKSSTCEKPAKTKSNDRPQSVWSALVFCVKAQVPGFCAQFDTTDQAPFGGTLDHGHEAAVCRNENKALAAFRLATHAAEDLRKRRCC
jgi:hypothetical protein